MSWPHGLLLPVGMLIYCWWRRRPSFRIWGPVYAALIAVGMLLLVLGHPSVYVSPVAAVLAFFQLWQPVSVPLSDEARSMIERGMALGATRRESLYPGRETGRIPVDATDYGILTLLLALDPLVVVLDRPEAASPTALLVARLVNNVLQLAAITFLFRDPYRHSVRDHSLQDVATIPRAQRFDLEVARPAVPVQVFDQRPPEGQEGGFARISEV